jgi:hypothetical protein
MNFVNVNNEFGRAQLPGALTARDRDGRGNYAGAATHELPRPAELPLMKI